MVQESDNCNVLTSSEIIGSSCHMTVVIATLGGPSLKDTIEALNQGSVVPDEVLICIPIHEVHRVDNLSFQNVKILATECRGQVAQRAIGFHHASYAIVMQLDDDLLVDPNCIGALLTTLKTYGPQLSVAPSLMNSSTGESIYKQTSGYALFKKIYYWFLNGADGYQPGKVTRSGSVIGVDPKNIENKNILEVEWLPGGCVMHYKTNLILNNYYPFKGKAYFEDIIHSYYLGKAGIKLVVDSNAYCWLDQPLPENSNLVEFLRQLHAGFKARKYTLQLFSRMSFRMYIVYFCRCIFCIIKKCI